MRNRRLHRRVRAALALLVTLSAAGCGTTSAPEAPMSTDPSSTPLPSSQPSHPRGVHQAIADLAGMLGISATEVTVARVEEVTWRDGSIGCAVPGMMYTQALVDGQRVVLTAQGKQYEYHSGGSRSAFYCEKPTE